MTNITTIFRMMPERYKPGQLSGVRTYYFSIGDFKYTVTLDGELCRVEEGQTVERADVVLKTTPKIFERLVIHGKLPGPIDIARGRFKTNDPSGLQVLKELFDF